VVIDDNEIPPDDDITFLIEPAKFKAKAVDDESIIVFCIDISGSMNVTKKLDGFIELKSTQKNISRIESLTGEKFDTSCKETYVSRLEVCRTSHRFSYQFLRFYFEFPRVFNSQSIRI
jgi:hypothetical protein